MNLKTAKPVEIDTRLAEVHGEISRVNAVIDRLTNHVLDHAGLRKYVSATWETRKSSYRVVGTYEEGVKILEAYEAAFEAWRASGYAEALRVKAPSDYSGGVDLARNTAERKAEISKRYALWAEANDLDAEYARRPWSRYFLVVSSAGHIHSSTSCQTCRPTTGFGWMPKMSGMTEEQAITSLGTHAEALCTVCFPTAPVARHGGKAAKVTTAKAAKLSAATFVRPE